MSEQPYMQLWVADFLGDTMHLSDAEIGQYMLLLMAMWRNGGTLPTDPAKLARIARNKVKPDVMAFFKKANGHLTQKRLLNEIGKARSKSASRAEAGRAGVVAKALKRKKVGQANGSAKRQHLPEPEPVTSNEVTIAREFAGSFYPTYPHKVGKADALKAYAAARKRATASDILDGLHRYVASKPPDRAWCNPATFLNQDRWLDQPAAVVNSKRAAIDYCDELIEEARAGNVINGKFGRRGICNQSREDADLQLSGTDTKRREDIRQAVSNSLRRSPQSRAAANGEPGGGPPCDIEILADDS